MVSKSNCLVEASYRLNISEQRVLALLVAQIHPDDEDFKPYRFKAADLQSLAESSNKDEHQRLRAMVTGLAEKSVHIRRPHGGWLVAPWLSSAEYFAGEGTVELCFDPKLKPYLLQLQSRFTSYKLRNIVKLRSRYSVRIYELLKQYEALGKRSFALDDLRKTLGLTEGEFATWKDFRRNVIELAERELPKKTDLGFSYVARKKGRAVASVDFTIWATREKDMTAKQIKALTAAAAKCRTDCNQSCAAQWNTHKSNPTINCYWCKKFERQRLEAQGQQLLPGLSKTPKLEGLASGALKHPRPHCEFD